MRVMIPRAIAALELRGFAAKRTPRLCEVPTSADFTTGQAM